MLFIFTNIFFYIKEINNKKIIDKPVYEIWVENNRNYFVGNDSILVYSEREIVE